MKNKQNMMIFKSKAAMSLALTALLLTACGGSENKPAGQSLARVNGQDITVHQLNAELERMGAGQNVSKKEILDGLIARQLLLEQAKKEKMDRDPKMMQAIERSKEQMLAQSYLQGKVRNVARPTSGEIEKFYSDNPIMFAKRKLFDTKELSINTADLTPELVGKVNAARSLNEVQQWLEDRQVKYVPTHAIRNSAEIPPQLVTMLIDVPIGKPFTVKQGEQTQFAVLQEVKDSPLTLAIAKPKIEQFLMLQKSREAGEAQIAKLRTDAKIEYLNDSDKLDEKQAAAPATAPTPKTGEAVNQIDRGVAGLRK